MENNLDSVESRLQKLKAKKNEIEKQIRAEKSKLSQQARKQRTRELIQLGGLVDVAGLKEADKGALLGALLSVASTLQSNSKQFQEWKVKGDAVLAEREKERKK